MPSSLPRSTPEQVVRGKIMARDIVLYSLAKQFTLTVPLSTQVYKWVPLNLILEVTLQSGVLQWTRILSKRKHKYSQLLHVTQIKISSGLMGHLV